MRCVLVTCLAGAACSSPSGEPIGGDVAFTIADQTVVPSAGAAIADNTDPAKQLIVVGTRDISCETSFDSPLRKGTYVTMLIDRQPGMQPAAQISIIRVSSSATLISANTGPVTIDLLGDRVTGNLTFTTTGSDGTALGAAGAFDVLNCSP